MDRIKIGINVFLCLICTHLLSYQSLPYEELFIPYPENIEQSSPSDIAIGCVFRNEAAWLKEWIEYHLLIGVDHFYLYNNCSTDHYITILSPYIEKGVVELFDFPKQDFSNRDQCYMFNHTLQLAKEKTKWLAIIDTDEFINPLEYESLNGYLEDRNYAAAIYIKWQIFGTSGVVKLRPRQLLTEALVFRAPDGDAMSETWGKSIYQTRLTNSIDNAHWGSHPPGEYIHRPSTNEIKINHYFFRTETFLYSVKLPRMGVWTGGHPFAGPYQMILDYLLIANSTKDDSMQRWIKPLKEKCFKLKFDVPQKSI